MKISLKNFSLEIQAYQQCCEPYKSNALEEIEDMQKLLPRGSCFDGKMHFDLDRCKPEKIVVFFEYHYLNENGYYDGWTEHLLTITPSFLGCNMKISGRNRNMVKDYLYDLFSEIFE